jgi:hypothetical protein
VRVSEWFEVVARSRSTTTWCPRRAGSGVDDLLLRQDDDDAWAFLLLYSCGPRSSVLVCRPDDLVVQPAELQLVPRAEVGGAVRDAVVAGRLTRLCAMMRPPVDRVLGVAAGAEVS